MSSAIIGSDGQDGRLLREQLEADGRKVFAVGRSTLDITNCSEVEEFLKKCRPAEVYYLAAFHHSAEDQIRINEAELFRRSFDIHLHGLVSFLDGIKKHVPGCRLLYAASSHVFGDTASSSQNESTPFRPKNVYAISKVAGIEACRYYRKSHGVYVTAAILYNHASLYRRPEFVSQKIVRGALAIQQRKQEQLVLGDLEATVDWGYAPDYVDAMQRCLKLEQPDDFVVATGETHTVREFVEIAFSELGLDWQKFVRVNSSLLNKPWVALRGDSTKLRLATGWQPSVNFASMVKLLLGSLFHRSSPPADLRLFLQ